ncbi:PIN domain-containing protein [Shinella sp. HZN7]|uniref:PIN domain-containing protein n=1 Tax=Shinella sp. (strain HZN7) TaxID=879274 RepID=UPI0007DA8A3E|nr:PIN domain-containing protein [Shinella sp. HZN7]ANH05802.1 PIN domain-containing protein [Shinella sp. HZN7]
MFANRFTAFIDACTLASVLRRNLLLSLAEAEFFRVRWSAIVLDETQKAIEKMLAERGSDDPAARALRHRQAMEAAFEDAMVAEFEAFECVCPGLPDPKDTHVVAAALKTQAAIIVTENLSDFPKDMLAPLGLEVRSADAFIADTVALETGRAVAAIRRMRERLKKPEKTADALLLDMEAAGLTETVDVLRPHALSL